jgi:hypothetical protein
MPRAPQSGSHALSDAGLWLDYQGLQHLAEIKPGAIAIRWHAFRESEAAEIRGRVLMGWSLIAQSSQVALVEFDGGIEMHLAEIHPRSKTGHRPRHLKSASTDFRSIGG